MVEIKQEDYYSNMYDLEKLTHLSNREKSDNKFVREIENLVVNNKCRDVKIKIEEYLNFYNNLAEIEMVKKGLFVKEILFQSYFNNESSYLENSPKECALLELKDYTYKSREELLRKMLVEIPVMESWNEINPNPEDEDEVNNFYMITESYIYELMAANHIMQTLYSYSILAQKLKDLDIKSIIDYGGGAGTLSILFKELGYRVDYADLIGKTFDFAKWRFEIRGLNIPMIDLTKENIGNYDSIICTEVFEHLVEPLKLLEKFNKILEVGQFLIISESCEHTQDFSSHLENNKKYGGEKFLEIMKKYGFEQIKSEPFIPQLIFKKVR